MLKVKECQFFLDVATLSAKQSNGIRLKVGGVVVDALGNIVATGYNGNVRGGSNSLEDRVYAIDEDNSANEYPYYNAFSGSSYRLVTKDSVIHAEMNIIAHAARRGVSINGGTMFLTHSPCIHCASVMIQSGIKDVVFLEKFRTYDEVYDTYKNYMTFTQWPINNA